MNDYGRQNMSPEDRLEEREIEKSLKTSTYLDDSFWEAIHKGAAPKVNVPNYGTATEPKGFGMDFEGFYTDAAGQLSPDQMKTAMANAHSPREDSQQTFAGTTAAAAPPLRSGLHVTRNQAMALKKYPTLIEFLGRAEGETVAKRITGDMNVIMADVVGANSKEANVNAITCKADKQNLKQYFKGDGWLCRVTASGPFQGDEAIYYHKDKDVACVLRRSEIDGEVRYSDISESFNIIYEAEQGAMPSPPVEEKTAEESVPETTSAVEGEENDKSVQENKASTAEKLAEGEQDTE